MPRWLEVRALPQALMKIDKKLVEKVAKIARLELSESEKEKFVKDFKEILAAFSTLNEVNTKNTTLTLQPVQVKPAYRDDVSKKGLTQSEALANTKHKARGYFRGPSST